MSKSPIGGIYKLTLFFDAVRILCDERSLDTAPRDKSSTRRWWDFTVPFWLGLVLCGLFLAILTYGPIELSRYINPWLGVAAAILALFAWGYLGPRPMPGILSGTICLAGMAWLFVQLVVDVLLAVHHGKGTG